LGAHKVIPTVSLECSYNSFLPEGGSEVNAIVTVSTDQARRERRDRSGGGEVIIVDVSGSMDGLKLHEAREATIEAIRCIADGVHFGVVAGNERAMPIYPSVGLVPSTPRTRSEAERYVRRLKASGGTAIGEWISLAARLLAPVGGVRHAILLTDGKDEHETPEALGISLAAAAGVFQCDCRGVGTDWSVSELRRVATALLGSVEIIAHPADLVSDFEAVMRQAMDRDVSDLRLRVWAPKGAEVSFLRQVAPELLDLNGARTHPDGLTWDFPTGAWGQETRDYHLAIGIPAAANGEEMLAARVMALVDGQERSRSLIRVLWTDDRALSTRVNRDVAHYTGQQDLAQAIQMGLDALNDGDEETAVVHLGRAVGMAAATGNTNVGELLAAVVEVDDSATDRVRLKPGAATADFMTLETRSTRTARVRK
jgi:hypothetical protein